MAVRASVLIQTDVGFASDVTVEVRRLPDVSSADGDTGPSDVIAHAEADTIDALGRMMVSQAQMIDGITPMLTCPVVTSDRGRRTSQVRRARVPTRRDVSGLRLVPRPPTLARLIAPC
jgi:hypothetical protein